MSDLAEFEVVLQPGRDPVVKVDGKNVEVVGGVRIYHDQREEMPVLVLEVRADKVSVSGRGGATLSLGQGIEEFLDDQDPDALQAEALQREEWGTPPMKVLIDLLKEKARGSA